MPASQHLEKKPVENTAARTPRYSQMQSAGSCHGPQSSVAPWESFSAPKSGKHLMWVDGKLCQVNGVREAASGQAAGQG